jgi:protein-S-isoprenylcysteine O-methyltransferase Ste14
MKLRGYKRIFGSGPSGVLVSLLLLGAAIAVKEKTALPGLGIPSTVRLAVLLVAIVLAIGVFIWSMESLPVDTRGRTVCDAGPYHYVRHPLYAAFVTLFCPALAFYLDHVILFGWAIALHALWHLIVRYEEGLMSNEFGIPYDNYAARTGRFIPRPGSFRRR